MPKFDIVVDFTEIQWGQCIVTVEANTIEEAIAEVKSDPADYDVFDDYEVWDSELTELTVNEIITAERNKNNG